MLTACSPKVDATEMQRLAASANSRSPRSAFACFQVAHLTFSQALDLSALALQFWLELRVPHGPGMIGSTINFFSYFTVLAHAACGT
jgi:hypothetical protein